MEPAPTPGTPPHFDSIEEADAWMAERQQLETKFKAERDAIWVDAQSAQTYQALQQFAGTGTVGTVDWGKMTGSITTTTTANISPNLHTHTSVSIPTNPSS